MAAFPVIDELIIFINRENFEQAALDIPIWIGVLHNIKIHKLFSGASCTYLGNPILKYRTKNKPKDYQRDLHTLSSNFILVSFVT